MRKKLKYKILPSNQITRKLHGGLDVYVAVKFYPWFKSYFPLFWSIVMYDNEFRQEP